MSRDDELPRVAGQPLRVTRWERFAQHLATGMRAGEAYVAAGFKPGPANATHLMQRPEVRARVAQIMGTACIEAVSALTNQHKFIQAAWARIELEVSRCAVDTAADLRALVEATVKAQQDQRVEHGGVSDRTAAEVTTKAIEDQAADEMSKMLDALAQRTRADDDEATKH